MLRALALLLLVAPDVRANVGATIRHAAKTTNPGPLDRTPLVVDEERLVFDCDSFGAQCAFQATYVVRNPTAGVQEVVVAFQTLRASYVELRGPDRPLPAFTGPACARLAGPLRKEIGEEANAAAGRCGQLRVEAGATTTLTAKGELEPENAGVSGYNEFGPAARHTIFGVGSPGRVRDFDYLLSPLRTWGAFGPVEVEVRVPLEIAFDEGPSTVGRKVVGDEAPASWAERREKSDRVYSQRFTPDSLPDSLSFRLSPPLIIGGPVVQVGGAFGARGGLRVAVGVEALAARTARVLAGAILETGFTDEVSLVPYARKVTDLTCVLPSLGVAIGAPMRFRDGVVKAGSRLTLDAMLYALGVGVSWDWLPTAVEADRHRFALFAQASL